LQVITSVAEFGLLIRDQVADRRRELEFATARRNLRQQADGFADEFAGRDPALNALRAGRDVLDEAFETALAERSKQRAALNLTNRRLAAYDTAIQLGWSTLEEGEGHDRDDS
jgi:hypothetical protein